MTNLVIGLIQGIFCGVLIYIILKRKHERETHELINDVDFLVSLLKREFPSWELLNSIHCEIVDKYRGALSDIFCQKFLTEKINFVVLKNFLEEMTKYISCGGKEELLKDIMKETIANVDNKKLVTDIADFIENQNDETGKSFLLISQAVYEKMNGKDTAKFFALFDQKIEEISEGKSKEKKSHIESMWYIIR